MLNIETLGSDILRKKCATIAVFDKNLEDLAVAMIDSMHANDGIGLAGPQVGVEKRLFVCHIPDDEPRIFINPDIIGTSQEISPYEEGCLSIPGVYSEVMRPESITVQAWSLEGKPFKLDAHGILARVIQHEMDHLKGILFIDHLSEKKRQRIVSVYEKRQSKIS
ncbi:MAG: peptide deformylase [Spirochaetia bacterium]|jgi:peptide deformylase|nr:peptide deformylase [Spirochaetia bacterium]